ncbi:toll/interleukin-1 receptor domain-containing protein [Streptomyces sp. 796.1]|uniref:toll/interleukin-1 receptor domain-containing protein n=1 Tax=Streptomyces sp. 796.1 TaxID=3163029 RepID=UPI0039C96796
MHEIFINYRTAGGKTTAYLFNEALSQRFGTDSVFLARKSIDVGTNFDSVLCTAVRRCAVFLALIDGGWIDTPHAKRPNRRALTDPQDWVRRELEEAFAYGVLVVPVLIGRTTEQLDPRRLPKSIAQLAECQYERFTERGGAADLDRLGDRLVSSVPVLAKLDQRASRPAPADPEPGPPRPTGQSGGIGTLTGNLGTFVGEAHGPLHTGNGDQINGDQIRGDQINGGQVNGDQINGGQLHRPEFNGGHAQYIAGDNRGGIHQRFEAPQEPEDGEDR